MSRREGEPDAPAVSAASMAVPSAASRPQDGERGRPAERSRARRTTSTRWASDAATSCLTNPPSSRRSSPSDRPLNETTSSPISSSESAGESAATDFTRTVRRPPPPPPRVVASQRRGQLAPLPIRAHVAFLVRFLTDLGLSVPTSALMPSIQSFVSPSGTGSEFSGLGGARASCHLRYFFISLASCFSYFIDSHLPTPSIGRSHSRKFCQSLVLPL
mmetsp:Transcript_9464/g.30912  ORF Transcript_9464/g.30912 Transcript_9464/m.30912 type:complete len:217 (+) Transcript_9464:619-1269(+)